MNNPFPAYDACRVRWWIDGDKVCIFPRTPPTEWDTFAEIARRKGWRTGEFRHFKQFGGLYPQYFYKPIELFEGRGCENGGGEPSWRRCAASHRLEVFKMRKEMVAK